MKILEGRNRQVYRVLHCGSWQCSTCGPWKKQRFLRALPRVAQENGLRVFMTLTIAHVGRTPEESYAYAARCFDKFRMAMKRKYGESPRYVKVVEAQPRSGYAHYHILTNRRIDYRELSWQWSAVGGGRIVHIRYADPHGVARYVSKYFVKSLDDEDIPRGKRRYTTSRGIHLFIKNESTGQWYMIQERIENLRYVHQDRLILDAQRYDTEQRLLSFEIVTRAP
jgi:hypothetical protein